MQGEDRAVIGLRAAWAAGWRAFVQRPLFWIAVEVVVAALAIGGGFVITAVLAALLALAGVSDPPPFVIFVYVLSGIGMWSLLIAQLAMGKVWVSLQGVDGARPSLWALFAKPNLMWRFCAGYALFITLVGLGLLLLVVPGVRAMLRWCCWPCVMVDRDLGVFASFAESARLTRGRLLKLLAFWVAAFALIALVTLLMRALAGVLLPSAEAVTGILGIPLAWLYNPLIWLSFTWIYRRLSPARPAHEAAVAD